MFLPWKKSHILYKNHNRTFSSPHQPHLKIYILFINHFHHPNWKGLYYKSKVQEFLCQNPFVCSYLLYILFNQKNSSVKAKCIHAKFAREIWNICVLFSFSLWSAINQGRQIDYVKYFPWIVAYKGAAKKKHRVRQVWAILFHFIFPSRCQRTSS